MAEDKDSDQEPEKDLLGDKPTDPDEQEEMADALEGELVDRYTPSGEDREVRVINRTFSMAEYDNSWSKIEWFLFIEIYNIVKEFYLDKDSTYVNSFSEENITVRVPINLLDDKLFNKSNRSKQLRDAAEGLMDKRVRHFMDVEETGQSGFDFIAMFPRITYDPKVDRDHMFVRIQSEIYEEMVPIEKFAQLDLKLMEEINTGNGQRLYAIFKSYSFKSEFDITFTDLRKKMGFFAKGKWKLWKRFNDKVLKPAVEEINTHKQYDIEVSYNKPHGKELISFKIKHHAKERYRNAQILQLDETIPIETRVPNRIQRKYIESTINNLSNRVEISSVSTLTSWIVSDLINMQTKQGRKFDFKKSMNAISKQISTKIYKEPYAHKHLIEQSKSKTAQFDDDMYEEIKRLERLGMYDEIRARFTDDELTANQYGHLIRILNDEDSDND